MGNSLVSIEKAFNLKANMLPVKFFKFKSFDIELIQQQLSETIEKAPNLFLESCIVLDFASMPMDISHKVLEDILQIFISSRMHVLGLINANKQQGSIATSLNITLIPEINKPTALNSNKPNKNTTNYRLFQGNVRSGQQIYANEGDLIVTGNVGTGAEVVATGNIHIYGTLRGKAIAGSDGDNKASIFCCKLQAEMLAIAGIYQLSDESDWGQTHSQIQVMLVNNSLKIVTV